MIRIYMKWVTTPLSSLGSLLISECSYSNFVHPVYNRSFSMSDTRIDLLVIRVKGIIKSDTYMIFIVFGGINDCVKNNNC